jgi:hypothetical protein
MNIEELAHQASKTITDTLADPSAYTEAVLDRLINQGREVTDLEIRWSDTRPIGAERVFDLAGMQLYLDGPDRGPTVEERQVFRQHLTKGDRLSTLSRPSQWVVTTSRGRSIVAWAVQWEPGPEDDPDSAVHVGADGWAVYELTTHSHMRREGRTLGHCVGNAGTGYLESVKSGACRIYSVRKDGTPQCTVEVRGNMVVQTQGRAGLSLESLCADAQKTWGAFWRGASA